MYCMPTIGSNGSIGDLNDEEEVFAFKIALLVSRTHSTHLQSILDEFRVDGGGPKQRRDGRCKRSCDTHEKSGVRFARKGEVN